MTFDVQELEREIENLKRMRLWSFFLLLVFLIAPVLIFVPILVCLEGSSNPGLSNLFSSLEYVIGVVTQSQISSATVQTQAGRIITVILSLLNLVFFGFIASIIVTTIDIRTKASRLPRRIHGR